MSARNVQHGQARRQTLPVWPVLAGIAIAVAVTSPLVIAIFGGA